ncbi:hypothetical protein BJX63DRAFT_438119 [Aspergillus granulosus]|uniref:Uncharacterized protein n=1 Tax=Aspergillus granulosus TaxID=176169 RepID=A0ABR4GSY2_9EURO
MPMAPTLAQIKDAIGADSVSLPDPCSLVREITENFNIHLSPSLSMSLIRQALDDYESNIPTAPTARVEPTTSECDYNSTGLLPTFHNPATTPVAASKLINSPTTPKGEAKSNHFPSYVDQSHQGPSSSSCIAPLRSEDGIFAFEETNPDEWRSCGWDWEASEPKLNTNVAVFVLDKSKIEHFQHHFDDRFWSVLVKGVNDSFHCEYDYAYGTVAPKVSWACFKIKQVYSVDDYLWRQLCIHVKWGLQTQRQLIFIFDLAQLTSITASETAKLFLGRTSDFDERQWNPFSQCVSEKNEARFPNLHDYARHLLHSLETIEVAESTIETLFKEQEHWRQEQSKIFHKNEILWLKTRQRLLFESNRAHSLKVALASLCERYINEINLGSNLAAQISIQATSKDSATMKFIATLTMVYLPGTFVSGIFGTAFFSVDSDGLSVSGMFWSYWIVALPLALLTFLVWFMWHRPDMFPTAVQRRFRLVANNGSDPLTFEKFATKFSNRGFKVEKNPVLEV